MSTPPRAPRAARGPRAATSPFTGKTLGRCRIGRPVGRGATATVFHADYLPLKKDVAVKILRAEGAESPEARRRFVEEAKALAKLDHPNVVKVFDVVEDEGYLLIIMDFVDGRSLRQRIEEDGPLDPEEAVELARQVALALGHAHGQRILHRDVKPGNIIVGGDGKAVLVDFGNAEVVGEAADRKGTAHYVAPEVFQGKHQDEKTDTYSLGATLFHMLTGEPPYSGQTVKEILEAHEAGRVRAPSQVNPEGGIPKELDTLVKRAMAPARGYRFAAGDLATALEEVVPAIRSGPRRVRPKTARGRGGLVKSKSRTPLFVGGILLLGCGVAAAFALFGGKEPEAPKAPAASLSPKKQETAAPAEAPKDIHDAGIANRAEARAAREAAGDKAMQEAFDFAARNIDSPKLIAERFASVASEYADLETGRKAREEEKNWRDRALTREDRAAQEAAKLSQAEKLKAVLEEGLKRVSDAVSALRFPEALGALQDVEPPDGKADEWKRRQERLNFLIGFADLVHEGLQGNAVSGYDVKASFAKPGEKIVRAGAIGLTLKSTGGTERTVPWTEAKPGELLALGRNVLPNRPEPRMALAAYCWEVGLKDDARKEMEIAMLTDRTGTVGGRLEELFGPEEQR